MENDNDSIENEDDMIRCMTEIMNLPKGWDYGRGDPVTQLSFDISLKYYKIAKDIISNMKCGVYPTGYGISTNYQIKGKDHFFDITVNNVGRIDIRYEIGIGQIYSVEIDKDDVSEKEILYGFEKLNKLNIDIIRDKKLNKLLE